MVSGGGHVGMTHLMTVTVTDNDPALPSLSIYELTVQEDMKVGELRVELSRPSDEVVMVQYTTSDLTAEAPSDYVSSRGMMVFEPQATHGAILVGIVDDAIAEGQEQLSVMLSEPKNAVIDRGDDGDKYLLPTSEVAIANLHRDEILTEAQLPLRYVAHTPCFRSEKASAGRDVRGIKRVHQFEKVEMFQFTTPEASYDALEAMTRGAESLCAALDIPYRRLEIVSGDLGFSASKKYDIEMWSPGCGEWLEVSSCSNTEAFQARRAGLRYYPRGSRKTRFLHTLNGSGLATPRTLIAILENNQQADGNVLIPEALRPYLGGAEAIYPK